MNELAKRLRDASADSSLDIGTAWNLLDEAADEIDRMEAQSICDQARIDDLRANSQWQRIDNAPSGKIVLTDEGLARHVAESGRVGWFLCGTGGEILSCAEDG